MQGGLGFCFVWVGGPFINYFIYVYECFVCVYVYTVCVCLVRRGVLDPLVLQL